MNRELFREALDHYGADLQKWPKELQAEAREALDRSEEFRRWLEQERRFETELRSIELPDPPAGLAERILAAAAANPQQVSPVLEKGGLAAWLSAWLPAKPAFALACLLVLGFLLGFWEAERGDATARATDFASIYNDGEMSWISDLNSSY